MAFSAVTGVFSSWKDDDLRKSGKIESNSVTNQRNLLDAFINRTPELSDTRLTLERMLKKGFKPPAIAEALGKCERSIYYEINRGKCQQITTDYEFVEAYCAEVAHKKYREFLAEKGPDLKIGHDHALAKKLEETSE